CPRPEYWAGRWPQYWLSIWTARSVARLQRQHQTTRWYGPKDRTILDEPHRHAEPGHGWLRQCLDLARSGSAQVRRVHATFCLGRAHTILVLLLTDL